MPREETKNRRREGSLGRTQEGGPERRLRFRHSEASAVGRAECLLFHTVSVPPSPFCPPTRKSKAGCLHGSWCRVLLDAWHVWLVLLAASFSRKHCWDARLPPERGDDLTTPAIANPVHCTEPTHQRVPPSLPALRRPRPGQAARALPPQPWSPLSQGSRCRQKEPLVSPKV